MGRWLVACFFCFSCRELLARPSNPQDIDFQVRFTKETRAYRIGEPIELERVYSTSSPNKYRISTSSQPAFEFSFTPSQGVVDLEALRWEYGWAGSILSGFGILGSQPQVFPLQLTAYYRFDRPGHYSVNVVSREITRIKTAEEGGGSEPLQLEFTLEFEILPPDPAWAASELASIQRELDKPEDQHDPEAHSRAIGRLTLLDTPASVRELLQRYFATTPTGDWQFTSALRESSQLDVIIPALQHALSDPAANIPSTLPELLAQLQTRHELGSVPRFRAEMANQPEWSAKLKHRSEVHDGYLKQANALLTASIRQRSGRQRATAVYQAWMDAESLNRTKPVPPETLGQLRADVFVEMNQLTYAQQLQFLTLAWQSMPHAQFLPLVIAVAKGDGTLNSDYSRMYGYKFWCEDWPQDCAAAILSEVRESKGQTSKIITLLLPESEQPEFDAMLASRLPESGAAQDSAEAQRIAALILRIGSQKLAPLVESVLQKLDAQEGCAAWTESYLLGYQFRFDQEKAEKRLAAALWGRKDVCGGQILRTLHEVRDSADLLPIAAKAIDSPNLVSAQIAALFLGEDGSASSQALLWTRLESLWASWKDRASELSVDPMSFGKNEREQTNQLEQSLACALVRAKNWKLDPAEIDRLRSGCLTSACRDVVKGQRLLTL